MLSARFLSFIACVLFVTSIKADIIHIGLLIEDHRVIEETAVKYAVEYANANILAPTDELSLSIRRFGAGTAADSVAQACDLVAGGVAAVISPGSSGHVLAVAPIFDSLKIPLVSASVTSSALARHEYVLSLVASDIAESIAIASIMTKMHWTRVNFLVSDDEYGTDSLVALTNIASQNAWQVTSVNTFSTPVGDVSTALNEVAASSVRVTVLVCSDTDATSILNQAKSLGMTGKSWIWLFSDAVTSSSRFLPPAPIPEYLQGLIGIGIPTDQGSLYSTFQSDWLALDPALYPGAGVGGALNASVSKWADAVLAVAYAVKNFVPLPIVTSNLSCLSTNQWAHGPVFLAEMLAVNSVGVSNQINLSNSSANEFDFNILNTDSTGWVKVATFNNMSGFSYETGKQIIFPGGLLVAIDFVSSVNGKFLRIVTTNEPPFQIFLDPVDQTNINDHELEGISIDIVRELSKALNFTYMWYVSPDGFYGGVNKTTGEWNGMVNELVIRKADMCVAPITINAIRDTAIDFTAAYLDLGIQFQMLRDPEYKPSLMEFLKPFSDNLWFMILGTMFVVGVSLSLLEKLSPMGYHGEFVHTYHDIPVMLRKRRTRKLFYKSKNDALTRMAAGNTLWFTFASMIQQGYETYPKLFFGRAITMVWWFSILMLLSFYTARLGSFEISSRLKGSINSIEDLYNQEVVSYGTVAFSSIEQFFCESPLDIYKNMCKKMLSNNWMVPGPGEAFGKLQNRFDPFSFAMDSIFLVYFGNFQPCNLRMVGETFGRQGYGFGLQKGSSYNDDLSKGILQLREQGFVEKSVERWIHNKSECIKENAPVSEIDQYKKTFEDLKGIFVIIAVATCISPILVMVEFIQHCIEFVQKKRQEGERWSYCASIGLHMGRLCRDLCVNYWPDPLKFDRSLTKKHQKQVWNHDTAMRSQKRKFEAEKEMKQMMKEHANLMKQNRMANPLN